MKKLENGMSVRVTDTGIEGTIIATDVMAPSGWDCSIISVDEAWNDTENTWSLNTNIGAKAYFNGKEVGKLLDADKFYTFAVESTIEAL